MIDKQEQSVEPNNSAALEQGIEAQTSVIEQTAAQMVALVSDNLSLDALSYKLDSESFEEVLCIAAASLDVSDMRRMHTLLSVEGLRDALQYEACVVMVQKYILCKAAQAQSTAFFHDFQSFCRNCIHYYKQLYQDTLFLEENKINLPRLCRFALQGTDALSALEAGESAACVDMLKAMAEGYPAMAPVVKRFLERLEQEGRLQPAKTAAEQEFLRLGDEIKKQVKQLIQSGQAEEALSMIQQLEQLLQNDEQIAELRLRAQIEAR